MKQYTMHKRQSLQKEILYTRQWIPTPPSLQPLATTNLVLVTMDVSLGEFHINGIIQYVTFCDQLLSQFTSKIQYMNTRNFASLDFLDLLPIPRLWLH